MKKSIDGYYKQYKRFPANNEAAGLPKPEHLIGNYVTGVEVQNGAMHIQLGNRVNKHVREKTLTLRPAYVSASPTSPTSWVCGHAEPVSGMTAQGENKTDVPAMYLSLACRSWKAHTEQPTSDSDAPAASSENS
ncbi:MAG: pilin [Pseudomonadota bacterium]